MPDEELLRFELRRAVEVAVQELPEIYREPVILRDFEGSQQKKPARDSRSRIRPKSRLHRGRLLLRERLRRLPRSHTAPADAGVFVMSVVPIPNWAPKPRRLGVGTGILGVTA